MREKRKKYRELKEEEREEWNYELNRAVGKLGRKKEGEEEWKNM